MSNDIVSRARIQLNVDVTIKEYEDIQRIKKALKLTSHDIMLRGICAYLPSVFEKEAKSEQA